NHGSPTTTYIYDLNSNLLSMTLPNGSRNTYTYDPRDRLTVSKEAHGNTALERSTVLTWDKASNLVGTTDPRNVVTSFIYDELNRVKETRPATSDSGGSDALGHGRPITTIGYDKNGNVWWVKNARGTVTSYAYDELDRRTQVIEAKGVAGVERQSSFAYD